VVIISAGIVEGRRKGNTATHRTLLMAPTSELQRFQSLLWLVVGVMQCGKLDIVVSDIPNIENYSTSEHAVEVAQYPTIWFNEKHGPNVNSALLTL
jgi:hypothetical protein